MKIATNRAVRAFTAIGLAGGLAIGAGASPASASSIRLGWLQLCSQGNYSAFVHVLSEPIPNSGGRMTGSFASVIVPPGQCWWAAESTDNVWVQVDVVEVRSDGSEKWIGDEWYNGNVSGMGIGAEGDQNSPWLKPW